MEIKNIITMSEMAKYYDLSKSTITFYVKKGLLMPSAILGNTYVFDRDRDLPKIKEIRRLVKKGVKIDDIDVDSLIKKD